MNTLLALFMTSLLHLIPAPVETIPGEGYFLFSRQTSMYFQDAALPLARDAAALFRETIEPSTGIAIKTAKTRPSSNALVFSYDSSLPAEGYTLRVTKDYTEIGAGDSAGFFYGTQTLLQLFPANVYQPVYQPDQYQPSLQVRVPCVQIKDYPRFSHRGMMLDVSRQFYTVEYVKRFIDWMSRHKLNVFHWHLSDDNGWRVEIKKYPFLTQKGAWRGPGQVLPTTYGHAGEIYGGYYTQQEIRQIVAYAAARHIEIIPEIDLPGHSKAAIASYPDILCDLTEEVELSIQGTSNNVWCASYEKNYQMLDDIVREMSALFPSRYFHIGGDEVVTSQWASCTRCTTYMQEHHMEDPAGMQAYFAARMQGILNKYEKTLVGWDDIMDGGNLDREKTVVHAWKSIEKITQAVNGGYRVIAQPASHCYIDMKHTPAERGMTWAAISDVEKVYSFDPVQMAGIDPAREELVLGIQGGLWSELMDRPERIAEYQVYPRLSALAEVAWSPLAKKDWEDFNTRLSLTHFDRLYFMGIRFRVPPPHAGYMNGYIVADNEYPWMVMRYTSDGSDPGPCSSLYTAPIKTDHPEPYRFAAFYRDDVRSIVVEADLPYDRNLKPVTHVTGNLEINRRTPLSNLGDNNPSTYVQCFGPLQEGQTIQFTFEQPVHTSGIRVRTGLPAVDIDVVDFAHVEYSSNGVDFKRVACPWENGGCRFVPDSPVLSVRLVIDKGNDPLTFYLQDLWIEK
ncbi:MAG: family 20 glycosylhydrolase [Bacteroidales bacterium]|jgi:hexosaminidase|nr:family 20 glycosylhydrolase [Bacteroidales bacterium]